MSDTRPIDCRFRLQDEGKPYPRSGCAGCGKSIFNGIPGCPRRESPEIEALRARAEKAEEHNRRNYELAQTKIQEIADLKSYIEKTEKEVAATISAMRDADKTVEQRQRAEKAEAERDAAMLRLKTYEEVDAELNARFVRISDARAETAEARVKALETALAWYGDQMCEGIENGCGRMSDFDCAGCRARAALEGKAND